MYRLIYKSRAVDGINWDTMRDILHISDKHNLESLLTGVLLATNTHFLQVLEGEFESVNRTYFSICRDERHEEVSLISFHPVEERLFGHWGMKGIGAFDFNNEVADHLKTKYGEEEGGLCFPLEEWKALALVSDIQFLTEHSKPDEVNLPTA